MRLFSIAIVFVFLVVGSTSLGTDQPLPRRDIRHSVLFPQRFGIVWNSVGLGLKNDVYLMWRPSETHPSRFELVFFYWGTLWARAYPQISYLLGQDPLFLRNQSLLWMNLSNGFIYLGKQKVGTAKEYWKMNRDPRSTNQLLNYGYQFDVPLSIDETTNQIELLISP